MKTEEEIKDEIENAEYLTDNCVEAFPSSIHVSVILSWVLKDDGKPFLKRECGGCDLTRKYSRKCRLLVDKTPDTGKEPK